MNRSTSGMSARCRCWANVASLIRSGLILSVHRLLREFACRLDDLGASAVVHAVVDGDDVVADRHLLGDVELLDDAAPHPGPRAHPAHPHAHGVEVLPPAAHHLAVEAHQEAHLLGAALPVLGGERVDRQVLDADLDGAAGDVDEHRLTHLVALGAVSPRWVAQRPLPSITTATCLGTWSAGIWRRQRPWTCAAAAGADHRWVPAGSSREDHRPRRRVGEHRVVVRRRGQLWELARRLRSPAPFRSAMGHILPEQRAVLGDRAIDPVDALHQRQRSQLPFQMPLQVRGHQPAGLAAVRLPTTPGRPPSHRRAAPTSDPAPPAAGWSSRTAGSARTRCRRRRCGRPDAGRAPRSGRTRSARAPIRRSPWPAAGRRPAPAPAGRLPSATARSAPTVSRCSAGAGARSSPASRSAVSSTAHAQV